MRPTRLTIRPVLLATPVLLALAPQALARSETVAPAGSSSGIERLTGVWIEGPGYDVSYGGSYESCAQRCLATNRCVMIEFYRPERKCNLYDAMRPRRSGGASEVGIRRAQVSSLPAPQGK